MKANASLQKLDLERNKITDAGASALAEALKANSSLQELVLDDNQITVVGAAALWEAWGDRRDLWKCPLRKLVGDSWVAKAAEQLKTGRAAEDRLITEDVGF